MGTLPYTRGAQTIGHDMQRFEQFRAHEIARLQDDVRFHPQIVWCDRHPVPLRGVLDQGRVAAQPDVINDLAGDSFGLCDRTDRARSPYVYGCGLVPAVDQLEHAVRLNRGVGSARPQNQGRSAILVPRLSSNRHCTTGTPSSPSLPRGAFLRIEGIRRAISATPGRSTGTSDRSGSVRSEPPLGPTAARL